MRKSHVHIAALFAMLFWGGSFIWSKIVFEQYTPLTTVFFRLVISCVFLFTLIIITKKWQTIAKQDVWLFLLSSFFNPFLYFLGENYGLQKVSASITAFIIATIPVFTPFVAYKIFGERLSKLNILGLILAFAGILLIIIKPDLSFNASTEGVALLFVAVFAAVVYTIFLKKLAMKYRPVIIIGWQNLIGAVYFLPLFLYFDFNDVLFIVPNSKTISSLFMLGIFASSLAFVLFTFVIKNIGISKGNIYTNLIPVFASIAAFFLLDERFTALKIAGMMIIVFGVTLSELEKKNKISNV
jgi:drug/metabolite transporter (DMT)-like permease